MTESGRAQQAWEFATTRRASPAPFSARNTRDRHWSGERSDMTLRVVYPNTAHLVPPGLWLPTGPREQAMTDSSGHLDNRPQRDYEQEEGEREDLAEDAGLHSSEGLYQEVDDASAVTLAAQATVQ